MGELRIYIILYCYYCCYFAGNFYFGAVKNQSVIKLPKQRIEYTSFWKEEKKICSKTG